MQRVTGKGAVFIRAQDADALRGWSGKFGWAVDQEGNRFELWQPPAGA